MSIATRIISATIGRAVLRYRTLGEWAETYRKIIDGKPVAEKTKANRRRTLEHILSGLGCDRVLSSIKPHEVAALVMGIHKSHPQLAKRVLIEAKDCFNEAVNYTWLMRSPAQSIKSPSVRVQRRRLTLEQWRSINTWAGANLPPWVSRMLILALVTGQRRSDLRKMRFDHVWGDHLHVEQAKTGERLALPLALRMNAIGMQLGDAIEACRDYATGDGYMLRKHNGDPPGLASLSARFEAAREGALGCHEADGLPPSLHEIRSLSARLYRLQGIDAQTLLGHRDQKMTEMYIDDRGLTAGQWRTLQV